VDTKILLARQQGVGPAYPLSREKLSPILAYYIVNTSEEGISTAERIVEFGGLGHSAVIHSSDEAIIKAFSQRLKAGRLIINSPSTHGAIGDIYNTNIPSLTLGCGSFGRNSTTSNVSAVNLINKKRVARRREWICSGSRSLKRYISNSVIHNTLSTCPTLQERLSSQTHICRNQDM
jgi:acetaldehyde dehydrogenase/alcohol dehydrogenase